MHERHVEIVLVVRAIAGPSSEAKLMPKRRSMRQVISSPTDSGKPSASQNTSTK